MTSKPSLAPRGAAPAVALRRARELFAAGRYADAAHSWNDWARQVPAGSWTIQVAAVRLDRAAAGATLGSGTGKGDLFMLPPGALPGRLLPVCVGVYPSEEAARRALAAIPVSPGSTSRPIVKPIESLRSAD